MKMKVSSKKRATIAFAITAVITIIITNTCITQVLAWYFNYHPSLNLLLFKKIYAPWAWFIWQLEYFHQEEQTFTYANLVFFGVISFIVVSYVLMIGFYLRTSRRHEGIHGTAHWASEEEIKETGLLPRDGKKGKGVYVGGWIDPQGCLRYLRHNGPEHIAVLAPTRSGKGVSLVIPTLLSWPNSVIVYDPKSELYNLTAGWRSTSQIDQGAENRCIKFEPTSENGSARFNPLNEVRIRTIHEVGDVQNLVTIIVDPEGKGLIDHWAKTAHAFLTGVILHLLYTIPKKTNGNRSASLPDVAFSLSDPSRKIEDLYQEMLENTHAPIENEKPIYPESPESHPIIAASARDMLNRPSEERGSVLSTAMSFLSLYRDPLVSRNVSESDFTINQLMNDTKPVSLYLMVNAGDKDRMKPLIRLIINQILRKLLSKPLTLSDGRANKPHKYQLLMLIDEFPSLGRLDVFQESLAYIAGYGIKAYLIMQDIGFLLSTYTHDETIISNCHIRVAFAPNKIETAEWLSRMTGTTTIVKEDVTTSGGRFGAVLQNVSRTFHEVSRPLMTPDEISRMTSPTKDDEEKIIEPGELLTFVSGHAPIKGTQTLYFKDPVFSKRAKLAPPSTEIEISQSENQNFLNFLNEKSSK